MANSSNRAPMPSSPSFAEPPYERAVIDSLRELGSEDPDFFEGVIGVFLRDAPRRVALAEDAIGRGELAAAALPVHSLKGSSAMLGARLLARRVESLEDALRGNDVAAARDRLVAVRAALDDAMVTYKRELGGFARR
jgi:HPt (histidine-containing phosphotransfer) domain-containing protein